MGDAGTVALAAAPASQEAFFVYKSGSTYYARNGSTRSIDYSGSVASTVIQSVVTATLALPRGGIISFSANDFPMDTSIDVPTSTGGSSKPLFLRGVPQAMRSYGTTWSATTSFPTNRYFIETSGATDLSNKYAVIRLDDMGFYNLNFATRSVGIIKFETDYAAVRRQLIMNNIYGQYMWRGIHVCGPLWWSYFNNIAFEGADALFSGDADIKLEQTGTYTHTNATVNGWPKANHFNNIICVRNPGTMVNSLNLSAGNYNTFNNYMVDGTSYTDSVFRFGDATSSGCENNIMYMPWSLDNTELGGQLGCLVLDGPKTAGNYFYSSKLTRNQYMLTIKNGAYRNYIQLAGYWGAHSKVDNVGCGNWNVIELMHGGGLPEANTENLTTFTGSATENAKIRIIDNRKGAYKTGVSTQSGDASTVAFNIAHGLSSTPASYTVKESTADARGNYIVTADATNLIVTYPSAPPTGSSNLTWLWSAGVY